MAMENPLKMEISIETSPINSAFSVAVFDYRRVNIFFGHLAVVHLIWKTMCTSRFISNLPKACASNFNQNAQKFMEGTSTVTPTEK